MDSVNDFGAKVSQPQFDVQNAADFNLLMSSSWPLLKIAYQGSFTVTNTQVQQTIVQHNLGYVPFYLIFNTSGATSTFDNGPLIGSNKSELRYFGNILQLPGSFTGYYYVFRLDIQSPFFAPIINTTNNSLAATNSDIGMKITKPGADVTSADFRDYVLHSATKSPLVHIVSSGSLNQPSDEPTSPGGVMYRVTHNLGYLPLAYSICNFGANDTIEFDPNYWYFFSAPPSGVSFNHFYVSDTSVTVDDDTFSRGTGSTTTAAIIVLKDPFSQNPKLVNY